MRYQEKIAHARARFSSIEEWIEDVDDLKTKLATYKATQEFIEVLTDLSAMIIKDSDNVARDDYKNFTTLKSLEIITGDQEKSLREANGLRNRLTHYYNGIVDEIAIDSFQRMAPKLMEILGVFETWIGKLE